MRLIDVDAIPESATAISTDGRLFVAWSEIVKAPTIDAVPVVRCKDCSCYAISPMGGKGCLIHYNGRTEIIPRKPDDFCSYGERKDGE